MKPKLPWAIKQECLWIVRGYSYRVKQYYSQRQDIIEAGGANYTTYTHIGKVKKPKTGEIVEHREQRREYAPHSMNVGRPTEGKQEQLEAIEHYPETRKMRAVDNAKLMSCRDIESNEIRQRMVQGLMLNIENGRTYPFEYLNLPEFSRRDFYYRREDFLVEIAKYLNMV
jgi:hypothetical protein